MQHPLKTFEPNELGRDFAIGDLHGAMPCFLKLLEGLDFDPEKDRMFSVADLVDRGPASFECLKLLKERWFHAVLANHELMMLEAFTDGYMGQFWMQNGGFWGYTFYNDAQLLKRGETKISPDSYEFFDLLPLVEALPYLITVKMKDGKRFHIVHAEFPPDEIITDEILEDPAKVLDLATTQTRHGDFFLWGRHRFAPFCKEPLDNVPRVLRQVSAQGMGCFNDKLSHIISGHTIVTRPMTILGQTNIDTGAYGACESHPKAYKSLTCVELGTWKFRQATPYQVREVEPFVVNKDDLQLRNTP